MGRPNERDGDRNLLGECVAICDGLINSTVEGRSREFHLVFGVREEMEGYAIRRGWMEGGCHGSRKGSLLKAVWR